MYKSPIDVMMADIQHQIAQQQDEEIYKAVVSVGINVDKDELIRALRYDRGQYEKGYADGTRDVAQKWIPVTERLPRYNEEVLVYRPKMAMKIYVSSYEGYYGEDDDEWHEGWGICGDITHWMPLPEPPKGE